MLVSGRISVREDKPPQLMCDQVWSLDHLPDDLGEDLPSVEEVQAERKPRTIKTGKLYLRLRGEDRLFQRVKDLFTMFPGQSRAVIYFSDTGRKVGAACLLHEALLEELNLLLGAENVVLKESV